MISSSDKISFVHEQIDIEEGEYSGWDVDGYPIVLLWDSNARPIAQVCQEIAQLAELRAAILRYAILGSPNMPFTQESQTTDIVALFDEVEQHIDETKPPSLGKRIKRLCERWLNRT